MHPVPTPGNPVQAWVAQQFGLYRPPGMLAGVCTGLAAKTGVPAWVFRLVFIVGNFLPGPGLIVYLILWFAIPPASES